MGMYCQLSVVSPAQVKKFADEPEDVEVGPSLSLEKAWHGLHYLLTGSAFEGEGPLGFLLHGGEAMGLGEPGEEDGEDEAGASRLLSPAEVQQVSTALSSITEERTLEPIRPRRHGSPGHLPIDLGRV